MVFNKNTLFSLFFSLFYLIVCFFPRLVSAETIYFIHQDHLSSTNLVTNQGGEVVSRQNYYPYGSDRVSQGDIPTERQYTSQVSDKNQTGLYYYNARYYDPKVAVFTQADRKNDSPNAYQFVSSNPTNNIDPSGNQCKGSNCVKSFGPPSQEAVVDLGRIMMEKFNGQCIKCYEDNAYEALFFARIMELIPEAFEKANNLTISSQQAKKMELKMESMGEDPNNPSDYIIDYSKKYLAMGPGIFSRLGEPLDKFSLSQFLSIWGSESVFSNMGVINNSKNVGFGTNAYKGMPIIAVEGRYETWDDLYDPLLSLEALVYNARYFEETSRITDSDLSWIDRYNYKSETWMKKFNLYMESFDEFSQLHPEYSFLTENMVKPLPNIMENKKPEPL